jgi:hypothetical protein
MRGLARVSAARNAGAAYLAPPPPRVTDFTACSIVCLYLDPSQIQREIDVGFYHDLSLMFGNPLVCLLFPFSYEFTCLLVLKTKNSDC